MSDTHPPWQITVIGVLRDPKRNTLFGIPTVDGLTLPAFQLEHKSDWLDAQAILAGFREQIGAPVWWLRILYEEEDSNARTLFMALALELLVPVEAVQGRWLAAIDHTALVEAHPQQHDWLGAFLTEESADPITRRHAPWMQRGWYQAATAWITDQVTELGMGEVERIELMRSWAISCVLRVLCRTGQLLYFKANLALPLFVNEPVATAGLAQLFPHYIAPPLAVEADHQWMLLAAFEGEIIYRASLPQRQQLMRSFAALQVESTQHIDRLRQIGCHYRSLDWTVSQFERILEAPEVLRLTDEELHRLRQLAPVLHQRCQQLAAHQVPLALLHGDLHPGNVAFRGEELTIFDWTDAAIGYPFLDMFVIYEEKEVDAQSTLREEYLAAWAAFEPIERLHELWSLAQPVFALHHLISYWSIVRHLEPSDARSLAWGPPHFARMLLRLLNDEQVSSNES